MVVEKKALLEYSTRTQLYIIMFYDHRYCELLHRIDSGESVFQNVDDFVFGHHYQ